MRKDIRIDGSTGTVIDADRNTHLTTSKPKGGPDGGRWIIVGTKKNGPFKVHFAQTPFDTAQGAQDISVSAVLGASVTRTAVASVRTYKYSVYDKNGNKTDDPNVIIDS